MEIYYINNKGTKLDLIDNDCFTIQGIESLFGFQNSYTKTEGKNGEIKISDFYQDNEEKTLTIGYMCDSQEEFASLIDSVNEIFEYDVINGKQGKLYVNDYYRECYIHSREYEEYEDLFQTTNINYTVVGEKPFWIKESKFEFTIESTTTSTDETDETNEEGFLDFPYDFPYDFASLTTTKYITNNSYNANYCKFIIYGSATNPSVTIGSNVYKVNTTLTGSEYLVIDPLNSRVYKVQVDGTEINCFGLRESNNDIFAKIKSGDSVVSWDGSFGFSLIMYDQRGEPRWN